MNEEEHIKGLESQREEFDNIEPENARLLSIIISLAKIKNVLEIGTSNGYSSIFLAKAIQKNEGKLVTIEIHDKRAKEAEENFKLLNLNNITLRQGDALEIIPKLIEKFDMLFIDAKKSSYLEYLKLAMPMLNEKAVIVAHDVVFKKEKMRDYLDYVKNSGKFESVTINVGHGLEISVRK